MHVEKSFLKGRYNFVLGYVNAENLSLMPAPGEETLIYVCGPPGFMDLISGTTVFSNLPTYY